MNKTTGIASILLAMVPALAGADTSTTTKSQQIKPPLVTADNNRYIILFHDKAPTQQGYSTTQLAVFKDKLFSASNANQLVSALGGKVIHALPSISGISAELTPQHLTQLTNDPQVKLIEKDPLRSFQTEEQPYGIGQIQADLLSDSNTGNIKICIPDTGIDLDHEDLAGASNISGEVSNTLTVEMDIGEWHDDSYGHGTHMAGTIAAIGSNNIGTLGVNPGGHIKLHIVKIVDNPGWWPFRGSDLIAAVERCQAAGANIINMSIAGNNSSVAEQQAMKAAYDAGILLVGASGKGGNADHKYPASYDSVISAAAIDAQEATWSNSHFNDQIELSAPGVDVKSTTPANQYANLDGTSVAAAYISGTAGLVWSHHPQCSNAQIRNILQQSAKDLGSTGRDNNTGHGLIQAKDAVDLIDQRGCDGNGVLNTRPTITGTPPTSVDEAQYYQFTPTILDADAGDTLTLGISNQPTWASFNDQTGELSGTPVDADVAIYSDIAITVTDSNGASASTQIFSIEVVNIDFPPTVEETEQTLSQQGSDIILVNPDGTIMSTISINDADSDPSNELQTLIQSGDTVTLSQSGGSFALIKGDIGEQGVPGDQGIPGDKGNTGNQGLPGDKGNTGDQGIPGDKGNTGDQGIPGDKGNTGDQGIPGDKGNTGDQGVPGDKGNVGDQGVPGDKGNTGDQGIPGDKGNTGDQGIPGDKGNTGDQGTPGDKGNTGDQGVPGDKGNTGDQGIPGDKGNTGDQGVPGDKGDKGDPGSLATASGPLDLPHPADFNNHALLVNPMGFVGINIDNGFVPNGLFDVQTTGGLSRFVVKNNGNIGIGSATPLGRFDVRSLDTTTPYFNIDSSGKVGIGTLAPVGRFEVRGSDATSSYFNISDNGTVSIGTNIPSSFVGTPINLDVTSSSGDHTYIRLNSPAGKTSGIEFSETGTHQWLLTARNQFVEHGATLGRFSIYNENFQEVLTLHQDGSVGFGVSTSNPQAAIDTASGAYLSKGGVWTNASSRSLKDNIVDISTDIAEQALAQLNPVTFSYKAQPQETYAGFIAEDVPDIVATNDRKSLAAMDIVAVLTKVLQQQQKVVSKQQKTIEKLTRRLDQLEKKK